MKQGWTIVRTSSMQDGRGDDHHHESKPHETREDPEVEGEEIVAVFETDEMRAEQTPQSAKFKHNAGIIKHDVEEIVKGASHCCSISC